MYQKKPRRPKGSGRKTISQVRKVAHQAQDVGKMRRPPVDSSTRSEMHAKRGRRLKDVRI